MAGAADHQVIVDGDAERGAGLRDLLVSSMSARDGLGSPDGWLCTRMTALAPCSSARLITSRGVKHYVVHRAVLLLLVGDQRVVAVEKEHPEVLGLAGG